MYLRRSSHKTKKYLYDSPFSCNFEHLSFSDGAITQANIDDFGILGELDIIKDDKWTIDLDDGSVVDSGSDVVIPGHGLEVGIEKITFVHVRYVY
jgi:hypothetical protein